MNTVKPAAGQWTLSVLVGLPLIGLVLLISLVVLIITTIGAIKDWDNERGFCAAIAGGALLVLLGTGIGAGVGYWPWKAEYHQYNRVTGTVATITSRLISAGDKGGTNQKFVVVLTSGSQQYGIEDTRAALLKPGDHVAINCKRAYEYGSSNAGYDCKWAQQ